MLVLHVPSQLLECPMAVRTDSNMNTLIEPAQRALSSGGLLRRDIGLLLRVR